MSGPDRMRCAVAAAETGSRWRELAARTQRTKRAETVDHVDLYGVAGEVVTTVQTLEDLAEVLGRQAGGHAEGRVLRDDAGADPVVRLEQATTAAGALREQLAAALRHANSFWSAVGHIGLDLDPSDPDQKPDPGNFTDEPREGSRP